MDRTKPSVTVHVVNTWLLANAIQAGMLALALLIFYPSAEGVLIFLVGSLAVVAISLPCLAGAYFGLDLIVKSSMPVITLFLVWLILCVTLVFSEVLLGVLIFSVEDMGALFIAIPGIIAVVASVLVRHKSFGTLVSAQQSAKVS